jgi:crotonobetainyl-CoA:carnitine CoA-transferase CaiB-like acyl-CoA transferase
MAGPLSGISVPDLSRILAGPWCTQVLADYGAEVINVERPGSGDDTRSWGPPLVRRPDGNDTGNSAYFMAANRGKKSVTLNIASAEGLQLVRSLSAACDVVLANYKFGDMKRYGLDYIRKPTACRRSAIRFNFCVAGLNTGPRGPYWANTRSSSLANCSA